MGRMYIVNHWNDAAAYSGEQIGDRLKDSTALHFNRDGSANVELYSEETALAKKKTSVPLKNRILPQAARLEKLQAEILELEESYRKGEMDIEEYSLLRSVAFKRRDRAQELLKKAVSVKVPTDDLDLEDTQEFSTETYEDSVENGSVSDDLPSDTPQWLLNVKDSNSLKKPLIKACKVGKTLVRWHQKARNYYSTLKAL